MPSRCDGFWFDQSLYLEYEVIKLYMMVSPLSLHWFPPREFDFVRLGLQCGNGTDRENWMRWPHQQSRYRRYFYDRTVRCQSSRGRWLHRPPPHLRSCGSTNNWKIEFGRHIILCTYQLSFNSSSWFTKTFNAWFLVFLVFCSVCRHHLHYTITCLNTIMRALL